MTDEHVLVSPLGRSPGAVSGIALALIGGDNGRVGNHDIARVITVGTSHPDVKKAARILTSVFHETEIAYEQRAIKPAELREEDDSADQYFKEFGRALEDVNESGATAHVAVTGGRSGMGALAALSTNLYGADYMWHLWVHDDIAKGGEIDSLQPPYTLENPCLNPTLEDGHYEVVRLPFIDLRPLHPYIRKYAAKGRVPDQDFEHPLLRLLLQSNLDRLAEVFPATISIREADRIVEMAQQYPSSDGEEQRRLDMELGRILERSDITDEATEERLRALIAGGMPVDRVLAAAKRGEDKTGFWEWLAANKDSIETATTTGAFIVKALELWLKVHGYIG